MRSYVTFVPYELLQAGTSAHEHSSQRSPLLPGSTAVCRSPPFSLHVSITYAARFPVQLTTLRVHRPTQLPAGETTPRSGGHAARCASHSPFRTSFARRESPPERPRHAAVVTLPDATPIDRSGFQSPDASPDRRDHATQELITLPDALPIDYSGFPSLDASSRRRGHAMQELITLPDAHPTGHSGFPSLDASSRRRDHAMQRWSRIRDSAASSARDGILKVKRKTDAELFHDST